MNDLGLASDSSVATLTEQVNTLLKTAFSACGLPSQTAQAIKSNRPDLGDLQCNAALSLAKELGDSAQNTAAKVAAELRVMPEFDEVSVAGPGFLNLRLSNAFIARNAERQLGDECLGIKRQSRQRVVLDFGGPNVAKPLHVGHLRSLVIGESLRRILSSLGHEIISDVHLGDWGLPLGMLIAEVRRLWPDLRCFVAEERDACLDLHQALPFSIADLQRLYPAAASACEADPARMSEARDITAALQAGHPGYRRVWRAICAISLAAFKRDFDTLDAHFDLVVGESDVQPLIPPMVEELQARGVAVESYGALVIEVSEDDDPAPIPPLLLVKSDGAALYATTDLATVVYRTRELAPARIIYVVDQRQSLHFMQVSRAAKRAGYASDVELIHAGFGTVNGPDGRPFKTRLGDAALLSDLLKSAIEKADERLQALEPDLESSDGVAADRALRARQVGIGAIKFADLSTHRLSNYVFDLERMLSFEGRTGPYVQYACVRICSILSRDSERPVGPRSIIVAEPNERLLVLECARFPEVVASAAVNLAPNEIAEYAFSLAQAFSRFYVSCPVLSADDSVRRSRLAICALTRRVLESALYLLGVAVPRRM